MELKTKFARRDEILADPRLRWLGSRLQDPNLWHLGRRAVSGACALGLFIAFVPIPIHMLLVPPLSILCRVNLPVALAVIWISNPVTIIPLMYFAYRVGCLATGTTWVTGHLTLEPNLASVASAFHEIWLPLSVGAFICGATAACIGYWTVQWVWRWRVNMKLRQRRLQRSRR